MLTANNKSLHQQNESFKVIVKEQENQIKIYQNTEEVLKKQLHAEKVEKQALIKANDELKQQIGFYKEEISSFEDSLAEFQKMKKVYENRLDDLEK